MGMDPKLPGDLMDPVGSEATAEELLKKVQSAVNRPPAQTALHKKIQSYMPPETHTTSHAYTKVPKTTPLGKVFDGPYPITNRLGKSCIELQTGTFVSGKPRKEIRHWRTCYPAHPNDDIQSAEKPKLGRKPLNAAAAPFQPRYSLRPRNKK